MELVGEGALRELAAVLRCDTTLLISSYELRLLQVSSSRVPCKQAHTARCSQAIALGGLVTAQAAAG